MFPKTSSSSHSFQLLCGCHSATLLILALKSLAPVKRTETELFSSPLLFCVAVSKAQTFSTSPLPAPFFLPVHTQVASGPFAKSVLYTELGGILPGMNVPLLNITETWRNKGSDLHTWIHALETRHPRRICPPFRYLMKWPDFQTTPSFSSSQSSQKVELFCN